jgi:hypothetical protein
MNTAMLRFLFDSKVNVLLNRPATFDGTKMLSGKSVRPTANAVYLSLKHPVYTVLDVPVSAQVPRISEFILWKGQRFVVRGCSAFLSGSAMFANPLPSIFGVALITVSSSELNF